MDWGSPGVDEVHTGKRGSSSISIGHSISLMKLIAPPFLPMAATVVEKKKGMAAAAIFMVILWCQRARLQIGDFVFSGH